MITVKTTDTIRIELDEPNGRSVTLTGAQWLAIFDAYKQQVKELDYGAYPPGLAES